MRFRGERLVTSKCAFLAENVVTINVRFRAERLVSIKCCERFGINVRFSHIFYMLNQTLDNLSLRLFGHFYKIIVN